MNVEQRGKLNPSNSAITVKKQQGQEKQEVALVPQTQSKEVAEKVIVEAAEESTNQETKEIISPENQLKRLMNTYARIVVMGVPYEKVTETLIKDLYGDFKLNENQVAIKSKEFMILVRDITRKSLKTKQTRNKELNPETTSNEKLEIVMKKVNYIANVIPLLLNDYFETMPEDHQEERKAFKELQKNLWAMLEEDGIIPTGDTKKDFFDISTVFTAMVIGFEQHGTYAKESEYLDFKRVLDQILSKVPSEAPNVFGGKVDESAKAS